jgi:hypothetical protein
LVGPDGSDARLQFVFARRALNILRNAKIDIGVSIAVMALALSAISFYRSYIYTKQQLDLTVTEVSYVTNQGELYMTVAFSNGGNRDAALLRVEPILWRSRGKKTPDWLPIEGRVRDDIPPAAPRMPTIVKAGGVEVIALSVKLDPAEVEASSTDRTAFVGIRVATMNSDGNLYLIQHPVAEFQLDPGGRIRRADPAIHRSLSGFTKLDQPPPGDTLPKSDSTPFVWADEHY